MPRSAYNIDLDCYPIMGHPISSGDLAEWLEDQAMDHVQGAPYHLQTLGKIERWHQTLKNRVLLKNYSLPGDLQASIEAFMTHYNHEGITRASTT